MLKSVKFLYKKHLIRLFLLVYYIPGFITSASNQCQCNIPIQIQRNFIKYNIAYLHPAEQSIIIYSNTMTVNYPNKIQFSGNVYIKQDHHIFTSDTLTISYDKKNDLSYILHANGNVYYNNDYITLTGQQAWFDINNKNIDINKGTYYFVKLDVHGTADTIMQRKKNRYTIIKNGNFTSCLMNDNDWNITGSKIMYDSITNNINIWNARFKIKNIPILYIPYLFLSLNQNNILESYIPNIKYTDKYGLILKIPCPIYLSRHFSGNIAPYYIAKLGMQLETKINYSIFPGTGLITFKIMRHDKIHDKPPLKKHYHEKLGSLHWRHNGVIHKKWYLHTHYISNTYSHHSEKIDVHCNSTNIVSNNINQKFICYYNRKNWHASIAYLGVAPNIQIKNHCYNYIATPQLTLHSLYNFHIQKNLFTCTIFHQLTKFVPNTPLYPKAIRIHTEPSIYYAIRNNWGDLNIETKLKLTHYQQKNTDLYNNKKYKQYHLHNTVNRIIPQIKIQSKIILKKVTHVSKNTQQFLESKLQYLYVPYRFQENIGIYDSSFIYRNYNNFFNDSTYSGLDRIASANQITGNIIMHYFNNTNELFYISIGQILNIPSSRCKNMNYTIPHQQIPSHLILLSGVVHWNINHQWITHTEIQYNIRHHQIPFSVTMLEYTHKKNCTFQAHYRYLNAQYIKNMLFNHPNKSIFFKTITQFGLLIYTPIHHKWKISFSHYFNVKTKKLINHTIGLQYFTPCWNIDTTFERKIIGIHTKHKNNIYDNLIKLDIKLSHSKNNFKSDPYKAFKMSILPYQYIF